jgi:hypothetical protein
VLTGRDAIAAPEVRAWFDALGSIDDIELVTEAWRADESSIPARFDGPCPHRPPMTHAEAMALHKTPGPAVRVTRWLWVQGAIRNDREVLWRRGEGGGIISTSLSFDGDEQRIYSFQVADGREEPIDGGMIQELTDAATGMVTPVEAIGIMADRGGTRSVLDFAASHPEAAELRRLGGGLAEFTLYRCLPSNILNQKRGMASDKSVRYTLDGSVGWMPVLVEYFGSEASAAENGRLYEPYLVLSNGMWERLGNGMWLPRRIVDSAYIKLPTGPRLARGSSRPLIAELDWDSVAVNAGRTIDDVRVTFPPGTLVLDELRQVRYIEGRPGSEEPLRTVVPVPTPDGGTVGMVVDGPGEAAGRSGGAAFSDDNLGRRGRAAPDGSSRAQAPALENANGAAGPSDGGSSGSGWWLALGGGLVLAGGLVMFWKRGRA